MLLITEFAQGKYKKMSSTEIRNSIGDTRIEKAKTADFYFHRM